MTPKEIINLGLAHLGSQRISTITPPNSALEKHCAEGYPQWRDSELSKRLWHFARVERYKLTQDGNIEADMAAKWPYKYVVPNDSVRILRDKSDRWIANRQALYSQESEQFVSYIRRVNEAFMDPLFVDVLAARVAVACNGMVTAGTESRSQGAAAIYREALDTAGRMNAFVRGPEDLSTDEADDSWVYGRYGWAV